MANNLKDHLKEVADAIRAKKGTTDLINPQDFATEIEGISGGDSGEGGGSNVEYLDLSGYPAEVESVFLMYSILAKYNTDGYGTVISTPFLLQNVIIGKRFKAVIIDFTMQMSEMGLIGTIKDAFIAQGLTQADLDAIPRLTKEQFYDLNA